jgi:ankyrin repeat protein
VEVSARVVKACVILTAFRGRSLITPMNHAQLFAAAQAGDSQALLRLLDGGTDPNQKGDAGERALMRAAANGGIDAINTLLERGADVNATTDAGNTALMFAAARGQIEAIRVLTAHGARTDLKNKYGLGAADWARWSDRINEILPLLDAPMQDGGR